MKDSFNPILKYYKTALAGLSVTAWALNAPVHPGNSYVVYAPITAIGDENKTCSGQEVSVRISIYDDNIITGKQSNVNDIADEIYSTIYPDPGSNITTTGMQSWDTSLVTDTIYTLQLGAKVQTQRVIIFNHKIFFN